jgi:hypothetical protein
MNQRMKIILETVMNLLEAPKWEGLTLKQRQQRALKYRERGNTDEDWESDFFPTFGKPLDPTVRDEMRRQKRQGEEDDRAHNLRKWYQERDL